MFRTTIVILLSALASIASAQPKMVIGKQRSFQKNHPVGDYSGITWIGGERYAMVDDKSVDGFHVFRIGVDSIGIDISSVTHEGFVSCGMAKRDQEGITWMPEREAILISNERDNTIMAYDINGNTLPFVIPQASVHKNLPQNRGLEALSYNPHTKRLWTCNEGLGNREFGNEGLEHDGLEQDSSEIYLVEYSSEFQILSTHPYPLDAPQKRSDNARQYVHGVSACLALDDGTVLMLEREFHVPRLGIGASAHHKLFCYDPVSRAKTLAAEWTTHLNLFSRSLANYEGMCLGPTLPNGSRLIILVSDSQSRYKGILKDWFKIISYKNNYYK